MARPWIGAVTFDLHGTLIHAPRLGEIYAEVLGRHGVAVEPARARRLVRLVWREMECAAHPARDRFSAHPGGGRGFWERFVERVCAHLGASGAGRFAAAELYERFAGAAAWALYPEVEEVLDALAAAGLRLGVVSNFDERLPRLLGELGLAARLDVVVHSAEVGAEKPHPRIFAAALERLDLPAPRVLHVGDRRLHDLEGALGAGLQARLLVRGGGAGELTDLADLLPLVTAHAR